MEIAFDAIGLEIPNDQAFDNLAADAGRHGESSSLPRGSGVLHGKCWRLGEGLEVWAVMYESNSGEIHRAVCRPAFRARYARRINPWIMTEFAEDGEALIHGYLENTDVEVLFELQNLTEVETKNLQLFSLDVSLCGLAYIAELAGDQAKTFWKPLGDSDTRDENDWSLCGKIVAVETISNPHSGSDLYWIYLDLGEFRLELLVNKKTLGRRKPKVGKFLKAVVWLQGHILKTSDRRHAYEGVDYSTRTVEYWKKFKKLN